MQIHWLWLLVGLMPYSIKRQHTKDEQLLNASALFWRLAVRERNGRWGWELSLPFLKHWRQ